MNKIMNSSMDIKYCTSNKRAQTDGPMPYNCHAFFIHMVIRLFHLFYFYILLRTMDRPIHMNIFK